MANFSSLFGKGTPANQPAFLLPLKGVIMFLSLVVLGISAYNLSLFNGYVILASTGPAGFMIFVAIKTALVLGLTLFLELKAPHNFYRPLVLALYALNLIFWLSAWSWSASVARVFLQRTCTTILGVEECFEITGEGKVYGATMAADAGLGALIWVLMIFVTFVFVKSCISEDPNMGGHNAAEMGAVRGSKEGNQPYVSTTETTGAPRGTPYGQQTAPYPSH